MSSCSVHVLNRNIADRTYSEWKIIDFSISHGIFRRLSLYTSVSVSFPLSHTQFLHTQLNFWPQTAAEKYSCFLYFGDVYHLVCLQSCHTQKWFDYVRRITFIRYKKPETIDFAHCTCVRIWEARELRARFSIPFPFIRNFTLRKASLQRRNLLPVCFFLSSSSRRHWLRISLCNFFLRLPYFFSSLTPLTKRLPLRFVFYVETFDQFPFRWNIFAEQHFRWRADCFPVVFFAT